MDLLTLSRILLRRWYVVIPTLTLTLAVAQGVLGSIEPTYVARGSLLLLDPPREVDASADGETDVNDNPLLSRNNALNVTGEAVVRIMSDTTRRREFREAGLSTDYQLSVDDVGSIINVTARSDTERQAVATVEALLARLPEEIILIEDDFEVADALRIESRTLQSPLFASQQNTDQVRAFVLIVGLGVAAMIALALGVESLAGRSRGTVSVAPAAGGTGATNGADPVSSPPAVDTNGDHPSSDRPAPVTQT